MRGNGGQRDGMNGWRHPEDEADLDAFQRRWLAACACYPVLRWPLTIWLGRKLAEADAVAEPDMGDHAPLFCLPWFRVGLMPAATRERLIASLSDADRRTVRRALQDILARHRGRRVGALDPEDEDPIFAGFMLGERSRPAERLLDAVVARTAPTWWRAGADGRLVSRAGLGAAACLGAIAVTALATSGWTTLEGEVLVPLPEMAILPPGDFEMGSPPDEAGRWRDEGPRHSVAIAPFAIARREVTVAEFARFVTATGHDASDDCYVWDVDAQEWRRDAGASWRRPGFEQFEQGDDHPVVCVNWEDAQAYVAWLNTAVDGEPYRLPSEAEWEYAARGTLPAGWPGAAASTGANARAVAQGPYFWGSEAEAACWFANGADASTAEIAPDWSRTSCDDQSRYTAGVDSYHRNGFGLADISGNVYEWIEDCWHGDYEGAPRDGSTWLEATGGDCSRRVVRGGSWSNEPEDLRSAYRVRYERDNRSSILGFRVARTLTP